jgi:hypothetical protein
MNKQSTSSSSRGSQSRSIERGVEHIKEDAASLGEQAKDQGIRYAEQGKAAINDHLQSFAGAIRRASDELGEGDNTMASQLVRQAADGLESLSRSVSGASLQDMVHSVREFGRSHPGAFIGGAVLAGIALGRFARSSAENANAHSAGDGQNHFGEDVLGDVWESARSGNSGSAREGGAASGGTGSSFSEGAGSVGSSTPSDFRTGGSPALSQGEQS